MGTHLRRHRCTHLQHLGGGFMRLRPLEAQFDATTGGRSETEVSLTFNSFTFGAADDQLNLVCDIKLCLKTDSDCNNEAQKMTADNLDSTSTDYFECASKYSRSDWQA